MDMNYGKIHKQAEPLSSEVGLRWDNYCQMIHVYHIQLPTYQHSHLDYPRPTLCYHPQGFNSHICLNACFLGYVQDISTKTEKMTTGTHYYLAFLKDQNNKGMCTQTLFMKPKCFTSSCNPLNPVKHISPVYNPFPKKANGSKNRQIFICTGFEGSRCSHSSARSLIP